MSVTYTSDARFTIVGNPERDDWNLRIDYVQPRDAGIYECQVNTEPKIYRAVTLKVLGEFLSLLRTPLLNIHARRLGSFSVENVLFRTSCSSVLSFVRSLVWRAENLTLAHGFVERNFSRDQRHGSRLLCVILYSLNRIFTRPCSN